MENNALPRIAVIHASAQGSTREIAEFIASDLAGRGATVEVADIEHAPDLSRFDAVVIGSAVHNMSLLPSVPEYIANHHGDLAARDVWLFSVGLGPALVGPIGRRVARAVPKKIAAVRDSLAPHEYRAFAGHYERAGVSLPARAMYRMLGGPRYGDLRDWKAIITWTEAIAQTLHLPQPKYTPSHP
ncbi:flavodoxin [Nocardia sp. SYP-A9097]|uniref:flavodoxin domain-containing protein n=1 Tax=Nocardia sp. SYP-A9097 TaxID=2663237 RepID=UPI00129B7F29|nr:flavodoxin domain-containing protein [Nocardia sp. SYP-A9097]MRH87611.1 flavodoxin [Nocardia sp. SYP-A9097]